MAMLWFSAPSHSLGAVPTWLPKQVCHITESVSWPTLTPVVNAAVNSHSIIEHSPICVWAVENRWLS